MTELSQDRPTGRAIRRGFCLRCPRCGRGALLRKYLKLHDHCDSCGMDFTPSRADDGPAYLTILVVWHLMAPLLHLAFVTFRPDPLTLALSFSEQHATIHLHTINTFYDALAVIFKTTCYHLPTH